MAENKKIEINNGLELKLAEAYIPIQTYTESYDLSSALNKGTLFPELYKPYTRK